MWQIDAWQPRPQPGFDLGRLCVLRGAGDLATAVSCRLVRAGIPVLHLELPRPSAVRRWVAFSEAVYRGLQTVEGLDCRRAADWSEAQQLLRDCGLALVVDPEAQLLEQFRPRFLVDAILAKRNLGTHRGMAEICLGLGPGFTAGEDVDAVIETRRGHDLGRVIYRGTAAPNSGVPGAIGGYAAERVLRAELSGNFYPLKTFGDWVEAGETVAEVRQEGGEVWELKTGIAGVIRGMLPEAYPVTPGFKVADVDPRREALEHWRRVSDKGRAIAGGVLEALLCLERERGLSC